MNTNDLQYQYEQLMIEAFHCLSRKEAIKLIHKADKIKQALDVSRYNAVRDAYKAQEDTSSTLQVANASWH